LDSHERGNGRAQVMRGMRRYGVRWNVLFLCLVVMVIASNGQPAQAVRRDDISLGESGTTAESWVFHPETGAWTNSFSVIPSDPNGYYFQALCLEDKGFKTPQCVEQLQRCTDGDRGRLVQWYTGLIGTDRSEWVPLGGTTSCIYSTDPEDVLDRIAARIQHEFERRPVAAGNLTLQPSKHTLRGAHTNVFADASQQSFQLNMLGQDVVIRVEPIAYTWNYGDGSSLGPTTQPGGPLPKERLGEQTSTSHVYAKTGDYTVSLTTTFRGFYRVNGGEEIPIPDSAGFSAAPKTISVWRSITNNYADNCLENPEGTAC